LPYFLGSKLTEYAEWANEEYSLGVD